MPDLFETELLIERYRRTHPLQTIQPHARVPFILRFPDNRVRQTLTDALPLVFVLYEEPLHLAYVSANLAKCDAAFDLAAAIRAVIADAIAAGGSSLRDYTHADGSLGYFQHSFAVYDREGEPCPTPGCGGHIRRIVQSGRSTFYCPACQK